MPARLSLHHLRPRPTQPYSVLSSGGQDQGTRYVTSDSTRNVDPLASPQFHGSGKVDYARWHLIRPLVSYPYTPSNQHLFAAANESLGGDFTCHFLSSSLAKRRGIRYVALHPIQESLFLSPSNFNLPVRQTLLTAGRSDMATLHRLTRISMLVKRNPALSIREFQRRWCRVWGPLSAPFLKRIGFNTYLQVHPPPLFPHYPPSYSSSQ